MESNYKIDLSIDELILILKGLENIQKALKDEFCLPVDPLEPDTANSTSSLNLNKVNELINRIKKLK